MTSTITDQITPGSVQWFWRYSFCQYECRYFCICPYHMLARIMLSASKICSFSLSRIYMQFQLPLTCLWQ